MQTVTATKARSMIYKLLDEASDSHEPIQITGKRSNAVLVAEDDWRAIQESLYLEPVRKVLDLAGGDFSHPTIFHLSTEKRTFS